MAVKKQTKPAAKAKQATKTPAKIEPVARPKLTAIDGGRPKPGMLAQLAAKLQQKHTNPEVKEEAPGRDGFGKPIVRTVVEFRLTLSDGMVLLAEGKHADVLFRYNEECQAQCQDRGLAVYNGPPLTRFTAAEWAARPVQAPVQTP